MGFRVGVGGDHAQQALGAAPQCSMDGLELNRRVAGGGVPSAFDIGICFVTPLAPSITGIVLRAVSRLVMCIIYLPPISIPLLIGGRPEPVAGS